MSLPVTVFLLLTHVNFSLFPLLLLSREEQEERKVSVSGKRDVVMLSSGAHAG